MVRIVQNRFVVGLAVVFVLVAAAIQCLTWQCLAVRSGPYALWVSVLHGRLTVFAGTSRAGSHWERFDDDQFPNGRWPGSFHVMNLGDVYNAGYGYNGAFSPVFSRWLGFWYYLYSHRSSRVYFFQMPAWPLLALAVTMVGLSRWRRVPDRGFEITMTEDDETQISNVPTAR